MNNLIGKEFNKAKQMAEKRGYKLYKYDKNIDEYNYYHGSKNVIIVKTVSEVPVAPAGYEFCAFGSVDTIVSYQLNTEKERFKFE